MKRSKILLIIMALFLIVVVSGCGDKHVHEYGNWELVVTPSEDETGKATRKCECGEVETVVVPALSDTATWEVVITDSTCTVKGSKRYTSKYGEIVIELPLANHEYGEWTLKKTPTETEVGEAERKCKYGETETVEVPVLTDSKVWAVEVINSTCEKDGKKIYTSVYGKVEITLPKLDHKFGDYVITVNPTETEVGEAERTCSVCNTKETIEVPVLTDTTVWNKVVVEATCEKEGKITYTSEIYNGKIEVVLPKLEHTYSEYTLTQAPTKTETGKAERICSVCNTKEIVDVPVLTDSKVWKTTVIEATCQKEGLITYTSIYGTVEEVIEKGKHHFGEWKLLQVPTEKTVGSAERKCKDCNLVETVEVPVLTDTKVWSIKSEEKADYNKAGNKVYTSVYGDVTINIDKLVAPYDNKTYYSFAYDAENSATGGFINGKLSVETAWNNTSIKLDGNGHGEGTSHPFRGIFDIKMVDDTTGKVEITCYENSAATKPESVVTGYVDFNTGIIVSPANNTIRYAQIWTPFESGVNSSKTNASSWDDGIAVEYVHGGKTHRMYITMDRTYFGVKFVDANDKEIHACDAYNSPLLYVKQDGKTLKAFAYDGNKLVEADGYEGSYSGSKGTLTLNGCKVATLDNVKGVYELAKAGSNYTADLYINNEYFELTLSENNYTLNKVMVNITLNGGEFGETNTFSVNKNIKYDLPILSNPTQTFKGWFYDELYLEEVQGSFIPTKDMTLYAYWTSKVIINIVSGNGNDTTLYLGDGDTIGEYLPTYELDVVKRIKFVGWYLDSKFETTLPEDAIVTEMDSGISIYAKWESLPLYFGSYTGVEVYGQDASGNTRHTLNIDADGNITDSAKYSGQILSYDNITQVITYKTNPTDTDTKKLFFDERTGVLIANYSYKNEIGSDFIVFVRDAKDVDIRNKFAIDIKEQSGSRTGFYARFLNLDTLIGSTDILVLYDRIYSNIDIKSSLNKPILIEDVKYNRTVVVKNNDNDETILAYGSTGETFAASNKNNVALDKYYGVYQQGEKVLKMDGVDQIFYDNKLGTYKKQNVVGDVFDVYLNGSKEYYELTLTDGVFKIEQVMINITFEMGEGHTAINPMSVNKNILVNLPNITEEGYVFNGWFFDVEFKQPVENLVPTKDVTLYAKFSLPAVLTLDFNNGYIDEKIVYSVGDKVELPSPKLDGFAFAGWYTTSTFDEGTKYENGTEILSDITLYAKWNKAPEYFNTFGAMEISGNKQGSSSSIYYKSTPQFDEYGKIIANGWYPFTSSQNAHFEDYEEINKTVTFVNNSGRYNAFISKDGLIVINQNRIGENMDRVWLLAPKETTNFEARIKSSYWLSGMARLIVYTDLGNINHNIFVYNNNVYFDCTFSDLEGNEITNVKEVYNSNLGIRLFDSNKQMIAEFGLKDNNLINLDGKQGTYTTADGIIVKLDGIGHITYDKLSGTYELAENETYTLFANMNNEYYEITLSGEMCTVVKPMVEVTFNPNGGLINSSLENVVISYNKNIEIDLPVPTFEKHIFKGWLDGEVLLNGKYTPTTNKTLIAKWNEAFEVTFKFGNGSADEVVLTEVNTPATINNPTYEGFIFLGWFTDQELTNKYNNEGITTNTILYAKWITTPPYVGSYTGAELYRQFASGDKSLVINPDLTFDNGRNSGSGQIIPETYDETTGTMMFRNASNEYIMYFKKFGDIEYVILNYSASKTDFLSDDIYVYIKDTVTKTTVETWNNNIERIAFFTGSLGVSIFYVNVETNEFIGNITLEDINGTVLTSDTLTKTDTLIIKDYTNKVVKEFGRKDGEFVGLDGLQGTYKNGSETITLNGSGKVLFNSNKEGQYVVLDGNNIKLVYANGSMKTVSLNQKDKTYTFIDDNTKGTYVNGTNTFVSLGNGLCTFNGEEGIYIYDGNVVTFFINGKPTIIEINSDGSYVIRSFLAGYKFSGEFQAQVNYGIYDGQLDIKFYETSDLTGNIHLNVPENYDTIDVPFTGSISGNIITLVTSNGEIKLTQTGNKLTVDEGKILCYGTNYNIVGVELVSSDYKLPTPPQDKTAIAGYTFMGTTTYLNWATNQEEVWNVKISFNNTTELAGTISFSSSLSMEEPKYYDFSYKLMNNLITMIITSSVDNKNVVKANLIGNTLTIMEEGISEFDILNMKATCKEMLVKETSLLDGTTFKGICQVQDDNGSFYEMVDRNYSIYFETEKPLKGVIHCEDFMGSTDYAFTGSLTGNNLVIKTEHATITGNLSNDTITLNSNFELDGHVLGKSLKLA